MECCKLLSKLLISYAFRYADFRMLTLLTELPLNLEHFVHSCHASQMPGSALHGFPTKSLVHYNGNSRGGHYNCVVAVLDKYGDLKWLFHDDNCKPVMWTILPEWFLFDVTHVWMIRSDQYQQWKQPPTAVPTQDLALANVLAQLRDT